MFCQTAHQEPIAISWQHPYWTNRYACDIVAKSFFKNKYHKEGSHMADTTKTGFGLLLFFIIHKEPHLATVMELTSNPKISKRAGSISFPLETVDRKLDQCPEDTINRLLIEELGLDPTVVAYEVAQDCFTLIPENRNIITRYAYGFVKTREIPHIAPQDTDIMFFRWMTMKELLDTSHTRIETRPILHHFVNSGLYLRNLDLMCKNQFPPRS